MATVQAIGEGLRFKRMMLKLSGEALMGDRGYGFDVDVASRLAADVHSAVEAGVQICIVVGGGNIFRGLAGAATGMDRATADYMGMLATVMNALGILKRPRWSRDQDARLVGNPDADGVRILCSPESVASHGSWPGCDFCGWHRQPVLHNGHNRSVGAQSR